MIKELKTHSRVIAELVLRLGRIASGEGLVEGLTPAQWTVLRYFSSGQPLLANAVRLRGVPWHDERHGVADD